MLHDVRVDSARDDHSRDVMSLDGSGAATVECLCVWRPSTQLYGAARVRAEKCRAGQGRAEKCRAGKGRAGQDKEGQGRARQDIIRSL